MSKKSAAPSGTAVHSMSKARHATSPQERYAALCDDFFGRSGVSPSTKKLFAASALTAGGRIFAMLSRDRLVVKLPSERVDSLVANGWGERFDANRGIPMKE